MNTVGDPGSNKDRYNKKAREADLEKAANENAAPRSGSFEVALRHLRNPQLSDYYQQKEGFVDYFKEGVSLVKAMRQRLGNGVEASPDGSYTLMANDEPYRVDAQGIPLDPPTTR